MAGTNVVPFSYSCPAAPQSTSSAPILTLSSTTPTLENGRNGHGTLPECPKNIVIMYREIGDFEEAWHVPQTLLHVLTNRYTEELVFLVYQEQKYVTPSPILNIDSQCPTLARTFSAQLWRAHFPQSQLQTWVYYLGLAIPPQLSCQDWEIDDAAKPCCRWGQEVPEPRNYRRARNYRLSFGGASLSVIIMLPMTFNMLLSLN
ncbi:uncharacterized protein PAC_11650 [Phialocephala subalpina]|uniref:Uncharacterized protein n=1 Tax=Phialocephala subalpina TaxID=576137 RepID=A0A1L7X9P8_9HELO|nr:uncharacterized protein PAC_11650 [Phialocephala subalpina]